MRLVVLGSPGAYTNFVANHARRHFDLCAVVYERRGLLSLIPYRVRRLGIVTVFGQLLFTAYDRLRAKVWGERKCLVLLDELDTAVPGGIEVHTVENVNDGYVRELLGRVRPDAVVVSGTGLLRDGLLSSGIPFVNLHTGLTPRYRGVHGGFWAVWSGDPEGVGVTVHLIDRGVDTGTVLAQAVVRFDPSWDDHRTLVTRQYIVGSQLMVQAISSLSSATAPSEAVPATGDKGKQWFSPTLRDYLRFRRQMRTLRRDRL